MKVNLESNTNYISYTKKLALGTVQFGLEYGISNIEGKTSKQEVENILRTADLYQISMLDTAQVYGDSEVVIGELAMNRFELVTKLDPNDLNIENAQQLIRASLYRLKSTFLYGVLFHNAQSALNNPKTVDVLKFEKSESRIKKWGYSVYTPEELEVLLSKYDIPDLIQVPYSHLDRRFELLLEYLHAKGVEIHTRSTFLQGLFFINPDKLCDFFDPVKNYLSQLRELYPTLGDLAANLLYFSVSRPFIDKVVIGINNCNQLKENIERLKLVDKLISIDAPLINHEILMPNLWPKN